MFLKIAILGAMSEEIEPLLKKLDFKRQIHANNAFYLATYGKHELIISHSKIGKVNAALIAAVLCEHYKAQMILFSGVAGSLNEHLDIGDLLIAKALLQHDLDITAFGHPLGFVPGNEIFIKTNPELNELAKLVAKQLNIKLLEGIIATGDQFICDEKQKAKIRQVFNADACEMEGAAVAFVAQALDIPCLILRSISDKAGEQAELDFDRFLEDSSKRSAEFILKICEAL